MKTKKLTRAEKEARGLKKPVMSDYEMKMAKRRKEELADQPKNSRYLSS